MKATEPNQYRPLSTSAPGDELQLLNEQNCKEVSQGAPTLGSPQMLFSTGYCTFIEKGIAPLFQKLSSTQRGTMSISHNQLQQTKYSNKKPCGEFDWK